MCDVPGNSQFPTPNSQFTVATESAAPVEFHAYPDVPREAVETARRIVRAARLDVGGIEYLEAPGGRRVFYDINANSNLRPSVAAFFGFDPFERVVAFLERELSVCSGHEDHEDDQPRRTRRPR
jgi:hypothetical protein